MGRGPHAQRWRGSPTSPTIPAPVCDPDLKYDQVDTRAASLAQQLTTELASFHEAGDVQKRVEERRMAAEAIMRALASKAMLFGPFLAELQADPARLGQRFLEVAARRGCEYEAGPGEHADHGGIVIDLGFDEPEQPAAPPPMRFGDEAVKTWLDDLERKAGDRGFSPAPSASPASSSAPWWPSSRWVPAASSWPSGSRRM